MPTREFSDERHRTWIVREVRPSKAERRREPAGQSPLGAERRHRHEMRVPLPDRYVDGWLLFRTGGERSRRLAPVPVGWQEASDSDLLEWCAVAESFGPAPKPILPARR